MSFPYPNVVTPMPPSPVFSFSSLSSESSGSEYSGSESDDSSVTEETPAMPTEEQLPTPAMPAEEQLPTPTEEQLPTRTEEQLPTPTEEQLPTPAIPVEELLVQETTLPREKDPTRKKRSAFGKSSPQKKIRKTTIAPISKVYLPPNNLSCAETTKNSVKSLEPPIDSKASPAPTSYTKIPDPVSATESSRRFNDPATRYPQSSETSIMDSSRKLNCLSTKSRQRSITESDPVSITVSSSDSSRRSTKSPQRSKTFIMGSSSHPVSTTESSRRFIENVDAVSSEPRHNKCTDPSYSYMAKVLDTDTLSTESSKRVSKNVDPFEHYTTRQRSEKYSTDSYARRTKIPNPATVTSQYSRRSTDPSEHFRRCYQRSEPFNIYAENSESFKKFYPTTQETYRNTVRFQKPEPISRMDYFSGQQQVQVERCDVENDSSVQIFYHKSVMAVLTIMGRSFTLCNGVILASTDNSIIYKQILCEQVEHMNVGRLYATDNETVSKFEEINPKLNIVLLDNIHYVGKCTFCNKSCCHRWVCVIGGVQKLFQRNMDVVKH